MNTVGFGDYVSQNSFEKFYNIIFISIACGIFALKLSEIGELVRDLSRNHKELNN